jgi:hypothetical protein
MTGEKTLMGPSPRLYPWKGVALRHVPLSQPIPGDYMGGASPFNTLHPSLLGAYRNPSLSLAQSCGDPRRQCDPSM